MYLQTIFAFQPPCGSDREPTPAVGMGPYFSMNLEGSVCGVLLRTTSGPYKNATKKKRSGFGSLGSLRATSDVVRPADIGVHVPVVVNYFYIHVYH